MQVETFEIESTVLSGGLPPEEEQQMLNLAEELGLKGQATLLSGDSPEEGHVVPYEVLDNAHQLVWKVLCPYSSHVQDYAGGVIPLRVLQVIAHAKPLCDRIEVWSATPDMRDPLLVGKLNKSYNSPLFLLARWGEELFPIAELAERAHKALVQAWQRKVKRIAACDVEALADEYLAGKKSEYELPFRL